MAISCQDSSAPLTVDSGVFATQIVRYRQVISGFQQFHALQVAISKRNSDQRRIPGFTLAVIGNDFSLMPSSTVQYAWHLRGGNHALAALSQRVHVQTFQSAAYWRWRNDLTGDEDVKQMPHYRGIH